MEFGVCSIFPDTSGVVFDTRSKMVMSQGGTAERMKEKARHNSIHTHITHAWHREPAEFLVNGYI